MEELNKQRKDYLTWDEFFMGVAKLAAQRSKDPSTQVGACVVSSDNRILSVGYNGTPNGYDDKYVCPEEIRTKIWEVYRTLKHELFVPQEGYEEECLQEFCKFMRENKHKAKVDKG